MAAELVEKSIHSLRKRAKVTWSLNGRVIEGLWILECFILFVFFYHKLCLFLYQNVDYIFVEFGKEVLTLMI